MHIGLIIINMVAALLFAYIFYLETIATQSQKTSAIFNISQEDLANPKIQNLFKNQGVYNLIIGLGLVYASFLSNAPVELSRFLHAYIIGVALYGAMTVEPKILLKQGSFSILFFFLSLFI